LAFQDRTLTCVECGREFTFTADDQEFHASKGYQEPKRCPDCRRNRREGGGSYGGGGGYGRGPRQMFTATCDNCGNEAQVPFQPRQDRPVYCSDCFSKVKPAGGGGGGGGRW
jgi:CxxC-x17-CxxC domain-containing protein